ERPRRRDRAEACADREGEERRLPPTRYGERGTQRSDAQPQREAGVSPGAEPEHDRPPRTCGRTIAEWPRLKAGARPSPESRSNPSLRLAPPRARRSRTV